MPEDTSNLILEHLRGIRADIGGPKDEVYLSRDRVDQIDVWVNGLATIMTTMVGAITIDLQDIKQRVTAFEGRAPAE